MSIEIIDDSVREAKNRYQGLSVQQRYALVGGLLLLLVAIPQLTDSYFVINAFILAFLFASLGQAWNIIGGYAGQVSIGHAVFYGAGAYTTTVLSTYYGISPLIGLFVGGVVASVVGIAIGAVTFRLRYHYFAMGTLAISLIAHTIFQRWDFINAAAGLEYPLTKAGSVTTLIFRSQEPYYYLIGLYMVLVTILVYKMDRSKLGIYLKSINMDQELSQNAGISIYLYKQYAFALSAFLTGVAGGLYSLYVQFINPDSVLDLMNNVEPIIVGLIGGLGTVTGPIIGAFIFAFVNEYTRSLFGGDNTGLGWVIFGSILILIAIYRPGGLLNKLPGREQ